MTQGAHVENVVVMWGERQNCLLFSRQVVPALSFVCFIVHHLYLYNHTVVCGDGALRAERIFNNLQ